MGTEMVPYRGAERPARDGCNVRLTIDSGLQMIVESEIDAAVKQFRPKMAVGVMMRPSTGEMLALANWPRYNPNEQEGVPPERRKNQRDHVDRRARLDLQNRADDRRRCRSG